jgi:hypothetical protein
MNALHSLGQVGQQLLTTARQIHQRVYEAAETRQLTCSSWLRGIIYKNKELRFARIRMVLQLGPLGWKYTIRAR